MNDKTAPCHDRIWLINMGDEIVWSDDPNPSGNVCPDDVSEFVSAEKYHALAAHVERLSVWIRGCGWHDDSCAIFDTDDEDRHCACDCGLTVAYDTPKTSLARRDAEQQKIGAASFKFEVMESVKLPFRPHIQGVFEAWLRRQAGGDV